MQSVIRYCLTFISLNFVFLSHSQNVDIETHIFNMPHSSLSATIDGELTDPIWQEAKSFSLNIVNHPFNNTESPVNTTAKIVENGEYIFISFLAEDPEPEKIKAFLGDRDSRWSDDIVGIKLDTFNNRRLNYEFFVNPFGVQMDSIKNVMTGNTNDSWNSIWDSFGKITSSGYQVEIAIPYRILNFEQNVDVKTWAFELVRNYPRNNTLRMSHIPFDRDNDCWICQAPEIKGFKGIKSAENLLLTPSIVASKQQTRNIYQPNSPWESKNDAEAGIDLRWGINSNTLLNVTLNPDFSAVEVDSGQLSINKTYSLFYDEKRLFFLENADYFSSDFDLVYTRNIADPDYGIKLTGSSSSHSYGIFATNDTQTNFIVPGNTGSEIASLDTSSHSAAIKYRYDFTDNFSIGSISTFRTSDNYHNYVFGVDSKYKVNDSNTLSGQILSSDTLYPEGLFEDFCYESNRGNCLTSQEEKCIFGNCQYTEQAHRTHFDDNITGNAYKVTFEHNSEFWEFIAQHKNIDGKFRADLGYIPEADIAQNLLSVERTFYGDDHSQWPEASLSGEMYFKKNSHGELLDKTLETSFSIDGPYQSTIEVEATLSDKVGLRHDESNLAIADNTTLFREKLLSFFAVVQPTPQLYIESEFISGDKIDYSNNRLGQFRELYVNIDYNFNRHLLAEVYFTHNKLDAEGSYVYDANLTELRLSYQFDVNSYLKLNLVYSDIDRNIDNNPYTDVSNINKNLSSQLIYAYKLNPQTVFYLGYSDNSYQDDDLSKIAREEKTFFTKISYAWMP